ncbi:Uma2 family endonuclease [Gemmata sp.]|uniref:Uma2 family endonuclease n=1 Tax=Gemmata sp. TaxID=1914242 RepID=UPI003F71744E
MSTVAEPRSVTQTPPPAQPTPVRLHPDPYDYHGERLFEVINGVRVEKGMGLIENLIATLLVGRLEPYCRTNNLGWGVGETMFGFPGSANDRKPDAAFVSFTRWPQARPIPRVNAWPVAPELAVEVISPTDKAFDVLDKLAEYFAAGVQRVWHVYSHVEQVFVFDSPMQVRVLTRADALTGDPIIPGFRLPLDELFPTTAPTP